MSTRLSESGQVQALVLVGLMVISIPTGLALAQGLTISSTTTDAVITPTLPQVNLTPTSASTPTPSSKKKPSKGDENTIIVDEDVTGAECPDADYHSIQRGVNEADRGDTVVVCEGQYEPTTSIEIQTANINLKARGSVEIKTIGQTAIRTSAPRVTIQGFSIYAERVNHTIAVGGRKTRIRDLNINVTTDESNVGTAVGIVFSDGRSPEGEPDPELGAASRSRIVNSTFQVSAQNSSAIGIWADADRVVINNITFIGEGNTTSIYSTGNETVIRDNSIRYPNPPRVQLVPLDPPQRPAVKIGATKCVPCDKFITNVSDPAPHNWAMQNRLIGNSIDGSPKNGIMVVKVANNTVIRNNLVNNTGRHGMRTSYNNSLIQNNTFTNIGAVNGIGIGIAVRGFDVNVINNIIRRTASFGLYTEGGQNIEFRGNVIQNSGIGLYLGTGGSEIPTSGRVINNTITGHRNAAIGVDRGNGNQQRPILVTAHRNRIWNNDQYGIHVYNFNPNDGHWSIFNATNNIWGCGGPSSGLRDPYTNRTANGSGDAISAGDELGYSNVHFDPFYVRQDITCSASPSNTPEPTHTPTPTPTPTLTPTPTPTPTPASGVDNGTGGTGGTGNGGTGDGTGDTEPSGESSKNMTAPTTTVTPPTLTATPSVSPPPTTSPTPMVEPGFGVLPWVIGVIMLIVLLANRSQTKK